MPAQTPRRSTAPQDQAHGLRQLFAGRDAGLGPRFVPLVHNPQVSGAGVVMERLCAAFAEQGLRTLVVDAADSASPPQALASVDLAACVEPLSAQVSYLAARGLAMQYLDSRATLSGFLDALRLAAPSADVVLLHAGAQDMRRMFAGRTPRPLLLAGSRPDSLTHAYGSMKQLSQRLGALAYDLVVAADMSALRARQLGDRLAECGDHFLGAALRQVVVVDPLASALSPVSTEMRRLAAELVMPASATSAVDGPAGLPTHLPMPQASQRRSASAGRMN